MSDVAPEPIVIHGVTFDERWVTITWQDAAEVSPRSQDVHQTLVDPTLVPEPLENVLEELREILTAAAIERRQPPKQFTRERP